MAQAVIHSSFAAGELSKNLYARVDLDKYHVGAALLRNFFVDYRGGASTRAGLEYIATAKSQTGTPRLIPFQFSTTETYVLEFGTGYVRFYSGGAPLIGSTTVVSAITQANPGVLTIGAAPATGSTVILDGIVGMKELNDRTFFAQQLSVTTISLTDLFGNPIDTTNYTAYSSGGTVITPYELVSPYSEADLPLLKFAQSADVMTLTHPSYPPYLLSRTAPNTFTLAPMVIEVTQGSPTGLAISTSSAGSAVFAGYRVTAVSSDGKEESLGCVPAYIGYTATGKNTSLTWTAPAGDTPSTYKIYKWGPVAESSSGSARVNMNSAFGFIGYATAPQFQDESITPDYTRQPPQYDDPFSPNQPTRVNVTTAGGAYTNITPPTVTFSGGSPSGTGHAILNNAGGVAAVLIDTPGSGTQTIAFSPTTGSPAATIPSYTPTDGTYPSCVSFFQQRQIFASSDNSPQTIWASQTGNVYNFDKSPISQDSDAITLALASRQVNRIKSMIPTASGLLCFTSSGPWLITGGGSSLAVTPVDVAAQPQASVGANDMPPIAVNNHILYVQNKGFNVRDLVNNYVAQSYLGTDRSQLANHLFYGYQLVEWTYAEDPFRMLWACRNDGAALAMAFVPEEEVYAWSQHYTQGNFFSTCSVAEGTEDAVYFIVKRFIQGNWINYIERLASRQFYSNAEFVFCLDSALRTGYTQPNATLTLSGVSGTVTVTADSSIFTPANTGDVIRGLRGGKGNITYISGTQVSMEIIPDGNDVAAFPTVPFDDTLPEYLPPGQWTLSTPNTSFRGLDQLAGKTVNAIADGHVILGLTVSSDGVIILPQSASMVVVGLAYQCQLQTLYLDTGEPTIQSKRKLLPFLTCRVEDTKGISYGPTFDQMYDYKDPRTETPVVGYTPPIGLFTGDLMDCMAWDWNTQGQVCVQQNYPLPASILGIIPEVVVGDTGR